jgi:hypothetical protein
MKRRLLNLLTTVSLLLCVGVAALWVRSRVFYHQDRVEWNGRLSAANVQSVGGKLMFWHIVWAKRWWPEEPGTWTYSHETEVVDFNFAMKPEWSFAGIGFGHSRGVSRGSAYADTRVVVPDWSAAVACAILPAAWAFRRIRMRMRPTPGHCPACGYDLRATPGRCPECGTAASVTPAG